ncbi:MAG TPA: SGNH/GDSL hydrolase family protein [Nitrospira sp.]|nr:SGNH/GDSL hydrolase family protein [Nitrospira sp.]
MRVRRLLLATLSSLLALSGCAGLHEKTVPFVYLANGASDATGVGATPQTAGYVFLITRKLDHRIPGVRLINLGVPGAGIDRIKEQVGLAQQRGTTADLVTVWTGANDLVRGDDPRLFRDELRDLRDLLRSLRDDISSTIVVANLPDITMLPRFRASPHSLGDA